MAVRCLLVAALLLSPWRGFAADGTFAGKLVGGPANAQAGPGWVFIQGHNHMLRRVEVAHAAIFLIQRGDYRRRRCNLKCLSLDQDVVVTAAQDSRGEWRAKRVEIFASPAGSVTGADSSPRRAAKTQRQNESFPPGVVGGFRLWQFRLLRSLTAALYKMIALPHRQQLAKK